MIGRHQRKPIIHNDYTLIGSNLDRCITSMTWNYEIHHDMSIDADNCPNCGKGDIINAEIVQGVQYVSMDTNRTGSMDIDDYLNNVELRYATCGHCGHELVDNT